MHDFGVFETSKNELHANHVNMYIEIDDMVDRLRNNIEDNDQV